MLSILPQSSGNVIGIKAEGVITPADYDKVLPEVESAIAEHDKISFVKDITDFTDIDPKAADKKKSLYFRLHDHIDKVAIIGNKGYMQMLIHSLQFVARLMHIEVRYFDASESDAAWEWARS